MSAEKMQQVVPVLIVLVEFCFQVQLRINHHFVILISTSIVKLIHPWKCSIEKLSGVDRGLSVYSALVENLFPILRRCLSKIWLYAKYQPHFDSFNICTKFGKRKKISIGIIGKKIIKKIFGSNNVDKHEVKTEFHNKTPNLIIFSFKYLDI